MLAESSSAPRGVVSVMSSSAAAERLQSHLQASTSRVEEAVDSKLVDLQQAGVTAKLLLAGGLAGVVSKTATAPLARVTILYQVEGYGRAAPPSLAAAFRTVVAKQGIAGLWRGNAVTVVHRMPYSAINFYAYERFTELLNRAMPDCATESERSRMKVARRLICGASAGAVAASLTYPLDLIRTQLAADLASSNPQGMSVRKALNQIVAADGVRGLYRGLGATLLQVAPNLALNYSVYETLRSRWMESSPGLESPTVGMSLACGSAAGLASSSITFPLDVVRRHMQVAAVRGDTPSYMSVIGRIARERGLRGFYAGLVPEYAKVVPGVAIAFSAYEATKYLTGVSGANGGSR